MQLSLSPVSIEDILAQLRHTNTVQSNVFPELPAKRQPVHTVYGGAHLFNADTVKKVGRLALSAFRQYASDPNSLAEIAGLTRSSELIEKVYHRVHEKLKAEAVEDYRVDFEDGYGTRSDEEEDSHALFTAKEMARGDSEKLLSPFIGIRVKPFNPELVKRSIRTLDIFITELSSQTQGKIPKNFVITLPKVTSPDEVKALVRILEMIESRVRIEPGTLKIELMAETPQIIFNNRGEVALPKIVAAAEGRCTAVHFGAYDYTASCNITAAFQSLKHSACDFVRNVMQVALAGTGIHVVDGATNIMPIGPHRAKEGQTLTSHQLRENNDAVHKAWELNYEDIRHSLIQGYYQGWDLHPGQLPIRYTAVYTFFLENLELASQRLKSFVEKAAQATLIGNVFDDAATGQGLLNFFLHGINCGALTPEEVSAAGLTLEEIQGRSFSHILEGRKKSLK